jgi:hypothetical protein
MKRNMPLIDTMSARDLVSTWLKHQVALLESSSSGVSCALDWLLIAWICEHGFDDGAAPLTVSLSRMGASKIAQRLNDGDSRRAFDELLTCDPLRVSLCYGILKRLKVECVVLETFINGLAESLVDCVEEVGPGYTEMLNTRLLLSFHGLSPAPPRQTLKGDDLGNMLNLLQADEPMIQDVATRVAVASRYGTAEVDLEPGVRETLCTVMEVWVLDLARKYKLERVALIVRSLAYLGAAHHAQREETLSFLLAQQHPTGRFGFFGPEVALARSKDFGFDESAQLHLPTTLACMWALAEYHGTKFRLMASQLTPLVELPTGGHCHVAE